MNWFYITVCMIIQLIQLSIEEREIVNFMFSYLTIKLVTIRIFRVMCQYWGAVILYAWKAAEMNPVEDDAIRKKDVEALIVQDLFYCSVFLPKTYSHKFNWV